MFLFRLNLVQVQHLAKMLNTLCIPLQVNSKIMRQIIQSTLLELKTLSRISDNSVIIFLSQGCQVKKIKRPNLAVTSYKCHEKLIFLRKINLGQPF